MDNENNIKIEVYFICWSTNKDYIPNYDLLDGEIVRSIAKNLRKKSIRLMSCNYIVKVMKGI